MFCDLFYSDRDAKKNLLELYNALFGENLKDPDAIEKVRLEDALFMNMKNDVSFVANRMEKGNARRKVRCAFQTRTSVRKIYPDTWSLGLR